MNKWILGVGLAAAIVFWASLNAFSATEYDGLFGDTTFDIGPWQMELLPDKQPYPSYVADPRRPRMHFGVGAISNEVPERSGGIITLDAGTRITLLKMQRGMYIPRLSIVPDKGLFSSKTIYYVWVAYAPSYLYRNSLRRNDI